MQKRWIIPGLLAAAFAFAATGLANNGHGNGHHAKKFGPYGVVTDDHEHPRLRVLGARCVRCRLQDPLDVGIGYRLIREVATRTLVADDVEELSHGSTGTCSRSRCAARDARPMCRTRRGRAEL